MKSVCEARVSIILDCSSIAMKFFVILKQICLVPQMFFLMKNNIASRSQLSAQQFGLWFSCVLACLVLAISPSTTALAANLPQSQSVTGQQLNQPDIDSEVAADKAEEAAKGVFKGFEQTKEQIGKTQTRKQGMDQGRAKASATLEKLSEQASKDPEELELTDQIFLKNLRGGDLEPETRTLK